MQLMRNVANRILPAAVCILFGGQSAHACSCVGVQPFCNALPSVADKETAIFVGVVRNVYPAESMQEYARALFPNVPNSGNFERSIDDLRNGLLRLWTGVLTSEEEQR